MVAIDDVSVDFEAGEIVAIVGENGAGKSSLMNVLAGLYRPDGGEIRIDQKRCDFRGPRDAIDQGIGMVHQHFMLVPALTVAENVVLGNEPTKRGMLDVETACAQVTATCQRFHFSLDPRALISDLTVGSQQKVEIVKALHRGAKILVLDEPTAVLTPQEADELFGVVRQLSTAGHTVVVISHKLKEVLAVAQRIVVMRAGKKVAEVRASESSAEALAELMVGGRRLDEVSFVPGGVEGPGATLGPASASAVLLETENIVAHSEDGRLVLRDVSMKVRAGEIVGIAGVDGNGQRELAEVLTGLRPIASGTLSVLGAPVEHPTAGALRRLGISHVPEDRLLRGIVGAMTVEENLALGRQADPPFARGAWIDFLGRRTRTEHLLQSFDVRPRDPLARIGLLSGGNQQKAVLARELDRAPKILIVVQPTRGLDIAAVAAVRRRLRAERDRGVGVLLVSLDLEEVLELSDRVYVMYGGAVAGELGRGELDERRIGRMMLGAPAEVAHA